MSAIVIRVFPDYDAILAAYDDSRAIVVVRDVTGNHRVRCPQLETAHPCAVLIIAAPARASVAYHFNPVSTLPNSGRADASSESRVVDSVPRDRRIEARKQNPGALTRIVDD